MTTKIPFSFNNQCVGSCLRPSFHLFPRVALTLEDSGRGVLRSGEPVEEIAARLGALPGVEALLLNCCAPQVRQVACIFDRIKFCLKVLLHCDFLSGVVRTS